MKPTFNEKFLAYLALISGLILSAVAEYYSILGLISIFSAAAIPVAVMGIALGIGKITATLWLKQNWNIATASVRAYLFAAIAVLMLITSMGIFGFLSKAHSDQSLVSGDVQSKIAVYDEKIKTSKENIDANRKALKQLDEAVDQVMARSTSEAGADKAVQVRRSQSKERARLAQEIETDQKKLSALSEERAPIAAEVRKVEAEVGPIKYIAAFFYGSTDTTILEKAVTWVIIILIVVFDPLAVILLLASQSSFRDFRERERDLEEFYEMNQAQRDYFRNSDPEIPSDFFLDELKEGDSPKKESDVVSTATVTESSFPVVDKKFTDDFNINDHPYLFKFPENRHPPGVEPVGPMVYKEEVVESLPPIVKNFEEPLFVQNEEQRESDQWSKASAVITEQDYQRIGVSRQELTLSEWIEKIKSGQIRMEDVPEHLILDIRARM